jgi:hypothetical protein
VGVSRGLFFNFDEADMNGVTYSCPAGVKPVSRICLVMAFSQTFCYGVGGVDIVGSIGGV